MKRTDLEGLIGVGWLRLEESPRFREEMRLPADEVVDWAWVKSWARRGSLGCVIVEESRGAAEAGAPWNWVVRSWYWVRMEVVWSLREDDLL